MYGIEENIKYVGFFPFKVICSSNPERMNAHWHSQLEFMFFYETNGCEYKCKDKKISVQSKDLIIANSAEVHECIDFHNSKVCCVVVDLKMLGEHSGAIFKNLVRNDIRIVRLFDEIASSAGKKTYDLVCASCIYKCLSILTEDFSVYEDSEKKKERRIKLKETTQKVLNYIEENLSCDLDMNAFSAVVHLSKGRLAHVFKENTGISPGEYIEKARLAKAMKMLCETEDGVSEIAHKCGFSDHSYFSARFKKYAGISPRDYRKKSAGCHKNQAI